MNAKILCVDDDENIITAYKRQLRRQFEIVTALGGESGLAAMKSDGPFAVIVSDMCMPRMDGIQFLCRAREQAPDSVRMMLIGHSDFQAALQAMNEGHIFRFLTKPCPHETLSKALSDGLRQYRLVTAERDLLEKTLSGSLCVLTEILAIVDSRSFGRCEMLRDLIRIVARELKIENAWELEVAAMLSRLGAVTIPPSVSAKIQNRRYLEVFEIEMLESIPEIGRRLLKNIPRLESVAQIILYQNKRFDGLGFPQDSIAGPSIPLGARILKVLNDLLYIESEDLPRVKALEIMGKRSGCYDPEILAAVGNCLAPGSSNPASEKGKGRSVCAKDLRAGHFLLSDLKTSAGSMILSAGHRISQTHMLRIRNLARVADIEEPIIVENV